MKLATPLCVTLSIALASFPSALSANDGKRPNIVVIMADDMGYADIGCYGGEVRTPNLNKLAAGGLRFTNFFNTARRCPTRASLLTGLYSHQAGVGHMTEDKKQPGYRGELNRNCLTIAELLRLASYSCYMVGKWHVSNNSHMKEANDTWPLGRGFERFFGTITGAGSYYKPTTLTRDNTSIEAPAKGFYYTDAISDNAVQFINDHHQKKKNPFFLYVAYTSPHWPLHALKEDVDRYRDVYKKGWDVLRKERHERMKKLGIVEPQWPASARDQEIPAWDSLSAKTKEELAHKMAVYAAQIDRMDQGIGRIVAALKDAGSLDDTLILFLADNGGCAEGGLYGFERNPGGVVGEDSSFASYGQCWAWLSNGIFRLYKHWVHGGGVSTPLIAHWPRHIQDKGTLRRQSGHLIDIMATCVDVSGAKYPAEHKGNKITPFEGKSLVPAFANKAIEREAIYWEHEGNRAILAGRWKLVCKYPGDWELYDLALDRAETKDLATKNPERVKTLAGMWDAWAVRAEVKPWSEIQSKKDKKKKSAESRAPALFDRDNLVAWCIVPFDSKNRSPAERAAMVKKLGLTRIAYDWRDNHVAAFEDEILQYKKYGIDYFAFWGVHDKALELFAKHDLHPQIWQTAPSPPGKTADERVSAAVKQLLPLVQRIGKMKCKLGLYNHGGWGGEPDSLVTVCKTLREQHKADHVGIVYNLHHGHGHIKDFDKSLTAMQPYLLCLNLNGMKTDGDKIGQKILPLGVGEHDVSLLKIIRASKYAGRIGIIGHTNDDVKLRLEDNLAGLDWLLPQLEGKDSGPRPKYRTYQGK